MDRDSSAERVTTVYAGSDADLVREARNGDGAAFDELVRRKRRSLIAAAYHLTGDADRAEDAAQEAFSVAWERLRELRDPERFLPWMHTIVHRICLRSPWGRRQVVVAATPPEIVFDEDPLSECDNAVVRAINELPRSYRELLSARYLSDMSYTEMAGMLGVGEGALRVRMFRAKRRLSAALAKSAREETEVTGYGVP